MNSILRLAFIEIEKYQEEEQYLQAVKRKNDRQKLLKRLKLIHEIYTTYKKNNYSGSIQCPCGGKFSVKSFSEHIKTKKHQNFIQVP
jgi:hypothetical protein